jgi:Cu+-exporting ATPase
VTNIILDKTGTLTSGHPTVVDVAADGVSPDTVVSSAARVEMGTDHPLARAVVAEATTRGLMDETANDVIVEPGRGVTGMLGSLRVRAGSLEWFVESNTPIPPALADAGSRWSAAGRSLVAVAHDDRLVGIIAVSDVVKSSAREAILALEKMAIRPIMASGDSRAVAEIVAREVGITEVHAPLSPSEKRDLIARLQSEGDVVAMVGDGINDAAALAQADLGIAMGHGTDVAIESSDIVIVSRDLRRLSDSIRLSRATLGTIRGNLVWAFGYNAVAIPIALAGVMGPAIAGIAMALSSVFVVANSARLSAFRMS